jgi:hypothetical protein
VGDEVADGDRDQAGAEGRQACHPADGQHGADDDPGMKASMMSVAPSRPGSPNRSKNACVWLRPS